jgi:hypothetical protein
MKFECAYCGEEYPSQKAAANYCTDRPGGKNEYGRWA